jgi:hypothetical protein
VLPTRGLRAGDWVSYRNSNGSSGHIGRAVDVGTDHVVVQPSFFAGRRRRLRLRDVEGWWPARTRDRSPAAMRSVG